MALSEKEAQAKKAKKEAQRKAKKAQLISMADHRLKQRGAPDFGAQEGDVLKVKRQIHELTMSNNKLVEVLKTFEANKIVDRAMEAHMMMQVILGILVENKLTTTEDLNKLSQTIQQKEMGLADKANGIAEKGDTMLIRFKLFHEQTLVDDQTQSVLAYNLGSHDLPCDEGMVGMKLGESRVFEVTFGKGFRFPDYIGKPLVMTVWCVGVKTHGAAKLPEGIQTDAKDEVEGV